MSKKSRRKEPAAGAQPPPLLPTRAPARSDFIGVKVTPDEKEVVERVAELAGHASLSDCLREAFNQYAATILNAPKGKKGG